MEVGLVTFDVNLIHPVATLLFENPVVKQYFCVRYSHTISVASMMCFPFQIRVLAQLANPVSTRRPLRLDDNDRFVDLTFYACCSVFYDVQNTKTCTWMCANIHPKHSITTSYFVAKISFVVDSINEISVLLRGITTSKQTLRVFCL